MEKLKRSIRVEINKQIESGVDTFYFGVCHGFDLLSGEIASQRIQLIELENPIKIKLILVIPFEEQAKKWCESDRDVYYNILSF